MTSRGAQQASGKGASHPLFTALRAQRVLGTAATRIAPATVAGVMAGGHLDSVGRGFIVFVALIVADMILERERHPLHLMALAAFAVRTAVPLLGAGLALLTFALAGNPEPVSSMITPVIGAWIVIAFASWSRARFAASRRVRVAVIGSPGLALGLAEELRNAGIRSYSVVGWIAGESPTSERAVGGPRRLGSLMEVREVVERHSVGLLVHTSGAVEGDDTRHSRLEVFERVADSCMDLPVRLIEASQLYEDLLGHVPLGQSNSAWFQYLLHPRYRAGSLWSKRLFDLVIGSTMLLLVMPLLVVCGIIVKLTDGGSILFRQRRVGERGAEFEMIKLRSMRVAAEGGKAQWSTDDDDRVTPIGRFMRRTHIDELSQLWNVIRGEMTIVGPRPERRELIAELERTLNYYDRRHLVKPGIAGWAQARCGYGGSEEGTGWKLCHDLFYLKHRSVYFDFLILIENVRVSLSSGVQFGADVRAPQEQFILGHPRVVAKPRPH